MCNLLKLLVAHGMQYYPIESEVRMTLKLDRMIQRVQAQLQRAEKQEEVARLAGLLIILQADYIRELQKLTVKRKVA